MDPVTLKILQDASSVTDSQLGIWRRCETVMEHLAQNSNHYLAKSFHKPLITNPLISYFMRNHIVRKEGVLDMEVLSSRFSIYPFFPAKRYSQQYKDQASYLETTGREFALDVDKDTKTSNSASTSNSKVFLDVYQDTHFSILSMIGSFISFTMAFVKFDLDDPKTWPYIIL